MCGEGVFFLIERIPSCLFLFSVVKKQWSIYVCISTCISALSQSYWVTVSAKMTKLWELSWRLTVNVVIFGIFFICRVLYLLLFLWTPLATCFPPPACHAVLWITLTTWAFGANSWFKASSGSVTAGGRVVLRRSPVIWCSCFPQGGCSCCAISFHKTELMIVLFFFLVCVFYSWPSSVSNGYLFVFG